MNTKKTVFSRMAKGMPKKQVKLSIVDDLESEFNAFESAYSEASYLAYEYGDEVISAYEDFRSKYDLDNYIINGYTRDLEELAENYRKRLEKLETSAQELGLDPSDIYADYEDVRMMVDNAQELNTDAKEKYREVTDYTGMPNFWN